ncbi:MAG TPA: NgoFVII family restriction endonuclease, partial [Eubacteriaceae bacterium]|nr:NgoFVII family restriction endonuclease [Eubacteriaceae bacterium]
MYYYSIFLESPRKIGYHSFQEALGDLIEKNPLGIQELMEILSKRKEEIDHVEKPIFIEPYVSLGLHGKYSTAQILAAFGYYNEEKKPSFREGVLYLKEKNTDVFFITLNKSEKDYSESTMYEDYALNERLFHWQSQSRTSIESETGKRYISHKERGGRVILFVREYKNKGNQAMPYVFLGEAEYVSHQGDRPISIVWRLKEDMPPTLLKEASKGAV